MELLYSSERMRFENYSTGTDCVKNNFSFVSFLSKSHCMVSEDLTYSIYNKVQKFGFGKIFFVFERSLFSYKAEFFKSKIQ